MTTIDADEHAYLALAAGDRATVDTPRGRVTVGLAGAYEDHGVAVVLADRLGARYVLHVGEQRLTADAAVKDWLRKGRTAGTDDRALWLAVRRELRAGRSVAVRLREEPYYSRTRPVAYGYRTITVPATPATTP